MIIHPLSRGLRSLTHGGSVGALAASHMVVVWGPLNVDRVLPVPVCPGGPRWSMLEETECRDGVGTGFDAGGLVALETLLTNHQTNTD